MSAVSVRIAWCPAVQARNRADEPRARDVALRELAGRRRLNASRQAGVCGKYMAASDRVDMARIALLIPAHRSGKSVANQHNDHVDAIPADARPVQGIR